MKWYLKIIGLVMILIIGGLVYETITTHFERDAAVELADQLIGVTMHEPGVSRLVSVDVEEAAQIAVM